MDVINKLAWLTAALTVLAWAFVPSLVSANVIVLPQPALVEVTVLQPPPTPVETATPKDSPNLQPSGPRATSRSAD